ncbi:putative defense protein Hdd11 [Synchiropus splendidus]|uniref:putative defense protein Hdd11 n=1 Tax=Synchiropus splendidus TaxID=270530 RepID=UPI00237D50FB|nr:putative defense protein Hdd11 [Synchiropus splendidus]
MLASAFLLLPALCVVHGYPSGAPTGACEDMMPRHAGVLPQPTPPPYTLLTDAATYQPGKPVTVTIIGPAYRGVLLEARTGNSVQALGSFTNPPPDTKLLTCSGNAEGAVTHANTNLKGNTTVYRWVPPTTMAPSNIYFMATVAQQRSVYWLNVRSKTLTQGIPEGLGLATGASDGLDHSKALLVLLLGFLLALG